MRFGSAVHPATWDDVPRLLNGAKLLINACSLGMKGQPELKIDLSPMAKDAVVADIVYVPLRTKLLEAAQQRGFKTSDGLDMLLHQARARLHSLVRQEAGGRKELRDDAGRRRHGNRPDASGHPGIARQRSIQWTQAADTPPHAAGLARIQSA